MAKDWIKIETVNDVPKLKESQVEKNTKENNFKVLINNTKSLSVEKMKERSEELYEKAKIKEDSLISAFDEKRLKSKKLIKQALQLKKEREKMMAKTNKNAKQKTENVSNEITEKAV